MDLPPETAPLRAQELRGAGEGLAEAARVAQHVADGAALAALAEVGPELGEPRLQGDLLA